MKGRAKIALIGAGNIGGTLAHLISTKDLADVVLLDVGGDMPKAKALDISQSLAVAKNSIKLCGTCSYEEISGSDVVIVTAGIARKPGMSRDDLIAINANIIKEVAQNIKKYASDAFIIVVTNPLDAMVYLMLKETGFNPKNIVGMAGVLDSSRLKYFLAEEFNIAIEEISCFVLGGHGDSMVPLLRYCSISGIALTEMIKMGFSTNERINAIFDRTRNGGGEIVNLLKNGSAFYAPAASAIEMAESYIKNKRKILPCAAYLQGEYGYSDIYVGVPVIIGSNGVEKIIVLDLNSEEREMFNNSVKSVQSLLKSLNI